MKPEKKSEQSSVMDVTMIFTRVRFCKLLLSWSFIQENPPLLCLLENPKVKIKLNIERNVREMKRYDGISKKIPRKHQKTLEKKQIKS